MSRLRLLLMLLLIAIMSSGFFGLYWKGKGRGRFGPRSKHHHHHHHNDDHLLLHPNVDSMQIQNEILLQWLRGNGGSSRGIALHEFVHDGVAVRGLIAIENLPEGTVLLQVPRSLMFTAMDHEEITPYLSFSVDEDNNNKSVDDEEEKKRKLFDGIGEDLLLAVRLLAEHKKGSKSKWYPYMQMLPSMAEYEKFHPMFASQLELEEFGALPLVKSILNAKRRVQQFWLQHRKTLKVSWNMMWWGFVSQLSRCYGVTLQDKATAVIVPVSDMGNTAYPKERIQTKWGWSEEKQAFVLTTVKNIRKGEEVFESYEVSFPKDNSWLAYMFGFTTPINPNPLSEKVENGAELCQKIKQEPLVPVVTSSSIRSLLLSVAREECNQEEEAKHLKQV